MYSAKPFLEGFPAIPHGAIESRDTSWSYPAGCVGICRVLTAFDSLSPGATRANVSFR
jgi:hypothetical protein